MWELVLCWFGACNEFLGIGYFCVGVSVSQNRHIAIFSRARNARHASVGRENTIVFFFFWGGGGGEGGEGGVNVEREAREGRKG